MSFVVDLSGGPGAITQGSLQVLDADSVTWHAGFNGSLDGAYANMELLSGSLSNGAGITGAQMQGLFMGSKPEFLSGFILQSGVDAVQGFTLLTP